MAPSKRKFITIDKLAKLGFEHLAELVVEHADEDPALRKKLRLALAANTGPTELTTEVDRRIRSLDRGKSFLDPKQSRALAVELDDLRTAITDRLATVSAIDAADRLQRLAISAPAVLRREAESSGYIEEAFEEIVAAGGHLWANIPNRNPAELAEMIIRRIESDDFESPHGLLAAFCEALGDEGFTALKERIEAILASEKKPETNDWRAGSRWRRLTGTLESIADLTGDVDSYVVTEIANSDGEVGRGRLGIAQRLLAAGRPAEALDWISEIKSRSDDDHEVVNLKLAALEALGRLDEAQALRYAWFEKSLSIAHLKDYLCKLPDFEDFEARDKAVEFALRHDNAHRALAFLIELPDLGAADRLIAERIDAFDGRHYELLREAARYLAAEFPTSAVQLYRRMVVSTLKRASANQYGYAVRYLKEAENLTIDAGRIEDLDDFILRLRQDHGRKWKFWGLYDAE